MWRIRHGFKRLTCQTLIQIVGSLQSQRVSCQSQSGWKEGGPSSSNEDFSPDLDFTPQYCCIHTTYNLSTPEGIEANFRNPCSKCTHEGPQKEVSVRGHWKDFCHEGFYEGMAKRIFSSGANSGEISCYQLKTKRKPFYTEKLIGKYQFQNQENQGLSLTLFPASVFRRPVWDWCPVLDVLSDRINI